jgi:WD40 repeat protein
LACIALRSLHQNSIKALDAVELTDNSWLIASGGDDNALGLTLLKMDDESSEYMTSALIVPNAHTAAVNAITIRRQSGFARMGPILSRQIVTASNDQVVKLWKVTVDPRKAGTKGLRVKRSGRYSSSVADISAITMFGKDKEEKVVVSGVGTEVWSIGY